MANVVNWVEIPVTNMNRAIKFYEKVLNGKMSEVMEMAEIKMSFFPMEGDGVGAGLCLGEWYKPSATDGPVVYLNGGEDLGVPLSKVESAGGKIIHPKTKINDDIGYMAIFIDCEGNRVAFHSPK